MFLTKYIENAALLVRELKGRDGYTTLESISKRYHVSYVFMKRVAGKMRKSGILDNKRRYGARLIKEDVTLKDLYLVFYPEPITNLQTRYVESMSTINI